MTGPVEKFLPGCYRNLPIAVGESLPGYLLRLAEGNGYYGIKELLIAATIEVTRSFDKALHKLRTSREDLEKIGCMAVGDPGHLIHFLGRQLGDDALFIHGCRVDEDAFLHRYSQICPLCLEESGLCLEEWDWSPVTTCPRHDVVLLDTCPACDARLDWTRSTLSSCGRCGRPLTGLRTMSATATTTDVSLDYAALAPFRYSLHGGKDDVLPFDVGFKVYKAMSLSGADWAKGGWPGQYLRTLPLALRHQATELLSNCRYNDRYHLPELRGVPHRLLAPLRAIPRPALIESQGMKLLFSEVGLPRPVAEAICSDVPLPQSKRGAELFKGRPPMFTTGAELARYLAVDDLTLSGVISQGMLEVPNRESPGFDIDQVLATQQFISHGLLNPVELAQILGVPLERHDPMFEDVFPSWNPRKSDDLRVSLDHIVDLQMQLTAKWHDAKRPANPRTLRALSEESPLPFQLVVRAVKLVLNGSLRRFDWALPFDWASISIDAEDINFLLGSARSPKD